MNKKVICALAQECDSTHCAHRTPHMKGSSCESTVCEHNLQMCGCVEYVERDIRDLNVNDFLANVRVNGAGEAILEALKQIGVNLRDTVKVTPKKAFDDMVRGMVRGMVRDEIENIRNTPFVDCTDPRFFVP